MRGRGRAPSAYLLQCTRGSAEFLLFALPGLLLGLWAQFSLRSTFARYALSADGVGCHGTRHGAAVDAGHGVVHRRSRDGRSADRLLRSANKDDQSIRELHRQLRSPSVAVVAHEMGHAVQDAQGYTPMRLRAAIVPAVSLGAWVGPAMFLIGLWPNSPSLAVVGLIAFSAARSSRWLRCRWN